MRPSLIMHVNYCEQGQSLQEICSRAVGWGFDGVEFRSKRAGVEESGEQYLDELQGAAEKAGLREVLFGGPGPDFVGDDAQKRAAELDEYIAFYDSAVKRFKMTLSNTFAGDVLNSDPAVAYTDYDQHGSAIATPEQWRWAADGFKDLGKWAEGSGLRLGFETHSGYLHDTVAATMRLVEEIDSPAVGVTFDYPNTALFPQAPSIQESIARVGGKLFYVHLKNLLVVPGGGHLRMPLADGQINNRELLRELKATGYDGPICIEAPRPGDREWFAQQDLAYLKSVLDDLDWN